MAIDVRGLIDYDLAAHLFDVVSNKGNFKYFIDENAKFKYDGHPRPVKMTKQDVAYIDSVMLGIGQMTGLTPKRDKKGKKSTFDIQKQAFDGSILGYMSPESWGTYLMFSDAYETNELNNLTRETIDHEIGHAIGLGHPYGSGPNPNYTTADTVMSYNSLLYENNSEMYFGYTPSDNNAISYWWGNTNNKTAKELHNDSPTDLSGNVKVKTLDRHGLDDDHDHSKEPKAFKESHGISMFSSNDQKINITSRDLPNYVEGKPLRPFILQLSDGNNQIDSTKWDSNIAESFTNYGKLTIHGEGGNDKLKIKGDNIDITGFNLSFSGGQGKDSVVLKNADSITGSAGLLFGFNHDNPDIPRAIKFSGSPQTISSSTGDIKKKTDVTPTLTIWDSVEKIKIESTNYKFDDLYEILSDKEDFLLADL